MTIFCVVTIWFLSSYIGYRLGRSIWKSNGFRWTKADRLFYIVFCLFFGPLAVLPELLDYTGIYIRKKFRMDEDARW